MFVAPARDLGLTPAPRVDAPVAFAAFRAATLRRPDTASSPRGVPRRACDEPRRRVSLSSALGPPRRFLSFQAVRFFRSFCAAPPPAAPLGVRGRSGGGRKSPRRPDASGGAGDAPAPKASGWLSAKRELRSSHKGLRAASEECGFAGVGGVMHAASGISRGMAGYVRHIVLCKKRKTA